MTFSEMLRTAFEGGFVDLSLAQTILIMTVSLFCGALICLVYRLTYRGALFSRAFCASLFAMTLITTLLIMAIRTNIYLSLGTLGALSIVRFRTAIKEPMDMAFLFLSISAGIICGANLLGIALAGVVFIGAVLLAVGYLPHTADTYILMVTAKNGTEEKLLHLLQTQTRRARLKSKTVTGGTTEYAWEVSFRRGDDSVVGCIAALPGVTVCTAVKSNSEYI